jgi:hypothetical protein
MTVDKGYSKLPKMSTPSLSQIIIGKLMTPIATLRIVFDALKMEN